MASSTQPAEVRYPLPARLRNIIRGQYLPLAGEDIELDNRSIDGLYNYYIGRTIARPWFDFRNHIQAPQNLSMRYAKLVVSGLVVMGLVALVFWGLRRANRA
jgi:hypothetical protein